MFYTLYSISYALYPIPYALYPIFYILYSYRVFEYDLSPLRSCFVSLFLFPVLSPFDVYHIHPLDQLIAVSCRKVSPDQLQNPLL